MVPTGLAESLELLWHFAGYMRLNDDGNITVAVNYEGDAARPLTGDPLSLVLHQTGIPGPDDLFSAPSPRYDIPGPGDIQFQIHVPSQAHVHSPTPSLAPFHFHHQLPPFPSSLDDAGIGGFAKNVSLTVAYQSGGDQEVIDVRQINSLSNNDFASVGPIDLHLQPLEGSLVFATAFIAAQDAIPNALVSPDHSQAGLLAFLNGQDSNFQQIHAQDAAYSVQPGQYSDGVLQDPSVNIHQTAQDALAVIGNAATFAPPTPTGNHFGDHIQDMYLSGNVTVNDAVVVGFNGLSGSMVILGDSYQSQLICQTNVLAQGNYFNTYGSGAGTQVTIDPNTVQNAAEFQNAGGITGPWMVGGPANWDVDVLHGSFFDIKSYIQTNYLSDNDVIGQTQSFGESQVVAGSNGMINALDFQNLSAQYDLIIVEGSYHRASMLYQTNVMADINHGWQIGCGDGSGAGSGGTISAGGDMLLNDATMIYRGATDSQSITPGILNLVHALDAQNGTLTADQINAAFPYMAGSAHVLLITGDYYDVTYLSQTNIMSDSNTAAQVMLAPDSQQSMVAGHDQAINAATIVTGGSLTTPYVQGHSYSDSMLIQTNIIATDSKITVNDPSQLAPELVAFTGSDHNLPTVDAPQLFGPSDSHHHADGLAGVMHA